MAGAETAEYTEVRFADADREEQARLGAVHALRLLEQPVTESIDRVIEMAAELCHTPFATINIVDEEWLHSIAATNGPQGRFPREDIPCDLVVRSGQELVVPDATSVPMLAASPVVDGTLASVGFYASVPLRTLSGHVVGTLCAYGQEPHDFSETQLKMLRLLADHTIGIFQMGDAVERARQAADQLSQQSRVLVTAFQHATDGIAVVALAGPESGRIVQANPAACTLTGRSTLVGASLAELLSGPSRPETPLRDDAGPRPAPPGRKPDRLVLLEKLDRLVSEPAGTVANDTFEHLTQMAVGTGHIYIQLVITLTRDDEGGPEHALVQMRDVTAQQAHEKWLNRQTQTDPLTGLGNRLAMRERLGEEISALRVSEAGLGVLMIDLDNFRAVNERLGRPAGDDLLCRMATSLVTALPVEAFATRPDGDKFVVITAAPGATEVQDLAGQVSQALAETSAYFGDRLGVRVGASIGTTFTRNPATDPDELIKAADSAMYAEKRRNRLALAEAPSGLHAVPSPRGEDEAPVPPPTPAPRHQPSGPGESAHPARSKQS
ncbi:diguanylate cyclase [Kineosporia sp. J2-2]|uniref:Diguanylate cyclase n=1 Tax=Kineosporia corallincola TaxID=2835133 RepID=A0ABS5TD78_9ACTN|nr:diguanylate cyclase [Kineosporia corallincola]MBT0768996.1 diguanylate cyclase [Kineosporia corallincola]